MSLKGISSIPLLSSVFMANYAIADAPDTVIDNTDVFTSAENTAIEAEISENREKRLERRNATNASDMRATLTADPSYKKPTEAELLDKKWQHVLPFYAQSVIDLGFELPLPFSISLIPNFSKTNVQVSNLDLKIPALQDWIDTIDLDEIQFDEMAVENASLQLRAAAWLFPFAQVGAHVGRFSGTSDMYVTIPKDIFDNLGSADCSKLTPPLPIGRPPTDAQLQCEEFQSNDSIVIPPFSPEYKGWNYGFTTNFVFGVGDYFALLPFSYTWSETDDGRTKTTTKLFSPRVGRSIKIKNWGVMSPYAGLSYMDIQGTSKQTDPQIKGTDVILTGLSYSVTQENEDKLAGLVGFNWGLTKHYSVLSELTYGKGRHNLTFMINYSF